MMRTDSELLRHYMDRHDEDAFSELVRRHLDLVWGAARRITKDDDLAKDVAQQVFSDLATKGRRLSPNTVLAGWLHRAACFAAKKCVRSYVRRSERERSAMDLQRQNQPSTDSSNPECLLPILDEGLASLSTADRSVVILRFFERKSFADLGTTLGIADDTAQKRVSRAIEKLRVFFQRRGLNVSATTLASTLGIASSTSAPASAAASIIATSLVGASSVSSTTLFFYNLQYQLLTMKTKIAVSALLVTTAATPLVWQHRAIGLIAQENAQLKEQTASLDALRTERDQLLPRQVAFAELEQRRSVPAELAALQQEAIKLRGADLETRRALYAQLQQKQQALRQAQEKARRLQADFDAVELSSNTRQAMLTLGLAARIFATDNDDTFPTSFTQITNELADNYVNGFKGGIPMDTFEWVPHARPVSEMEPQLALFREKSPRQMPDGTWERYYTLCDGSAQILTSDTKDFSELEAAWIATDPTIPEGLANLPAYRQSTFAPQASERK